MKQLKLALIAVLLTSYACKKDDKKDTTTPTPTPTQTGEAVLELDNLWGNASFQLGAQYITLNNDTIVPSQLKYYISNIRLTKTDNTIFTESESYHLVDLSVSESNLITIKNIPAGEYSSIEFMVGVDSTRNCSGAQTGALDPSNGMFWTWNSGYIFVKFEGSIGAKSRTLQHHIGGYKSPNINMGTISSAFNGQVLRVSSNAKPQMHFEINLKNYFTSPNQVDLQNLNVAMSPNQCVPLAINFRECFEFDHIHN